MTLPPPRPPATEPLETIVFPSGQRHDVVAADAQRLVIELSVAPMAHPNVPHVYDSGDEVFEVLGGHQLFSLSGVAHHLAGRVREGATPGLRDFALLQRRHWRTCG